MTKTRILDSAKLALLDDLSSSCQHAYYLKLVAASNQLTNEVNELDVQIKSLRDKVDLLRDQLSKEWLLKIEEVHANVAQSKADLEDAVAMLRRDIDVIQNVAKGIDYFQKIVEMAARIAI